MIAFLFVLGRTSDLSYLELTSRFENCTRLTPDVASVELSTGDAENPKALLAQLGGTIKIAWMLGTIPSLEAPLLARYLLDIPGIRSFGISMYGDAKSLDPEVLADIKTQLSEAGVHTRYVEAHDGNVLSSVVVAKQKVTELIVVSTGSGFIIGQTLAVQDVEAWSTRDYGRPFADPKSGMLPPKVARMAVNLAHSEVLHPTSEVLLDPFCGMGTILGEALLSGWQVIGSDQSEEVVGKAKKNIEWLTKVTGPGPVTKFFVSDATHVSEHLPKESIDAIVTEPFLGSTQWGDRQVKNIIKGLEKLYIGCLRDWVKVLKPNGKVVIALPQYAVHGKTFFVKNVIDRCENLGYTVVHGPIEYSRPQAVVRRQFYIFRKK
ncbi:MAG: methyltransferase domain-containing protein [Patescibacteria group bacterium]